MLNKTRIAVMVSGGGTNLQAIIDAQKSGIITSGEIALVVSNKADAYALERARNNGIDSYLMTTEEALIEKLQEENRDDEPPLPGGEAPLRAAVGRQRADCAVGYRRIAGVARIDHRLGFVGPLALHGRPYEHPVVAKLIVGKDARLPRRREREQQEEQRGRGDERQRNHPLEAQHPRGIAGHDVH